MKNDFAVIVFDLGNVLIPFDYNIIINKLNKIDYQLGDRFYKKYKENYHVHRQYEKWDLTNDQFLDIMLDWLDHKVEREEFCKIYSEIFVTNDNVIALIPKLKENYKVVLLSNTNYIHEKYGYGHYPFLKEFDKLFLSHEVGAVKPEEKIYRTVEKFTQEPSSKHLFIDDVEEYVEGAKKCGWDAIQFKGYDKLINDLEEREIKF